MDKQENIRIGLTGHEGFIGQHLLKALESQKISSVIIKGDVCKQETWKDDFDILIHLAAAMPGVYVDSHLEAFQINVEGTLMALEACRLRKARMIFPSTSGIYDPSSQNPFQEDSLVAPPTLYAQSKLMGEHLCQFYQKNHNISTIILRLFNVYGSKQHHRFLIPYLLEKALKKETAEILHLHSSRDFVYVEDVVDLFLKVISSDKHSGIYNVGSGQVHSVEQVIHLINQGLGQTLSYHCVDQGADVCETIFADIHRIQKTFDWSPKIGLKQGIEKMIGSFEKC